VFINVRTDDRPEDPKTMTYAYYCTVGEARKRVKSLIIQCAQQRMPGQNSTFISTG